MADRRLVEPRNGDMESDPIDGQQRHRKKDLLPQILDSEDIGYGSYH
jgi:hypothetical protein